MRGFTAHVSKLPDSVQKLLQFSVEKLQPDSIVLFGSRARGNHRENSDFDIAFKKKNLTSSAWNDFLVTADDEPITLYKVDLVHYENMDENYKSNINQEGLILYE